ncbi:hypothetical protein CRG98_037876 [Punica granatum]|uniref:Uncharacterized protein n=1 Tax=Punica granatum TaxID=22663 RepID=A0A2I0IDI1_PUNGR|nr:hypothetical protein CRG98_037876 [Punica granatum]
MGRTLGLDLRESELGRGLCGRRFSPLDAAVRAGMDAGDGSRHHRGFAVVDLGLTGVKTVGIGENFAIFRRRFPSSSDLQIPPNESIFSVFVLWVLFLSIRIPFLFI